jgi:hypothetical protein
VKSLNQVQSKSLISNNLILNDEIVKKNQLKAIKITGIKFEKQNL